MKSQKGFVIPLIVAIIAILAIGGVLVYENKKAEAPAVNPVASSTVATTSPIIGGDKDEHGCLGPAGYSWCAVKNKCLRVWEEKCEMATTTPVFVCQTDTDCREIACVAGGFAHEQCVLSKCTISDEVRNRCSGTTTPAISTTTAKINQKIIINGMTVIPLEVTEDSRCPQEPNLACFWAGTVKLDVELNGQKTSLTLGTALALSGKEITLIKILPIKKAQTILLADYSFEFSVVNVASTSCTPNWTCGWSPCNNGYQAMKAVDSNNCGVSSLGINIVCPALARECTTNCSCPAGYIQEGNVCNPNCYYSTPKCLMASIQCSAK